MKAKLLVLLKAIVSLSLLVLVFTHIDFSLPTVCGVCAALLHKLSVVELFAMASCSSSS